MLGRDPRACKQLRKRKDREKGKIQVLGRDVRSNILKLDSTERQIVGFGEGTVFHI